MHLSLIAGHKVVARGPSVSDQRVKVALSVKDDPVGTRRTARVDLVRGQDRELVPRTPGREAEPFVVVVLVRITACKMNVSDSISFKYGGLWIFCRGTRVVWVTYICTWCAAGLVVGVSRLQGLVNIALLHTRQPNVSGKKKNRSMGWPFVFRKLTQ
jgi:hypothetical protein